ncbi:hypothetical protein BX666DRAFT_1133957 [Dichotomocladium elegans]|nr:hypothetical protein BX666DRAFT_1133957 [Dichotomocladium elegans]
MDIESFFGHCRQVLDTHHDRRDRIIKLSRDITGNSKKMIFALHSLHRKSVGQTMSGMHVVLQAPSKNISKG